MAIAFYKIDDAPERIQAYCRSKKWFYKTDGWNVVLAEHAELIFQANVATVGVAVNIARDVAAQVGFLPVREERINFSVYRKEDWKHGCGAQCVQPLRCAALSLGRVDRIRYTTLPDCGRVRRMPNE
jgi:hypothetical protein